MEARRPYLNLPVNRGNSIHAHYYRHLSGTKVKNSLQLSILRNGKVSFVRSLAWAMHPGGLLLSISISNILLLLFLVWLLLSRLEHHRQVIYLLQQQLSSIRAHHIHQCQC